MRSDDVHSDGSGEIAIRQMRQNGRGYQSDLTDAWRGYMNNGHAEAARAVS